MSEQDELGRLYAATRRLVALLEDPHPGLWVWQDMLAKARAEVAGTDIALGDALEIALAEMTAERDRHRDMAAHLTRGKRG